MYYGEWIDVGALLYMRILSVIIRYGYNDATPEQMLRHNMWRIIWDVNYIRGDGEFVIEDMCASVWIGHIRNGNNTQYMRPPCSMLIYVTHMCMVQVFAIYIQTYTTNSLLASCHVIITFLTFSMHRSKVTRSLNKWSLPTHNHTIITRCAHIDAIL